MSKLTGLLHIARSIVARRRADAETAEEIAFHIDRQTQKHIAKGMSPGEARTLALREFGGTTRWRAETADTRRGQRIDSIRQDLAYAARLLRRAPGFTALSVLTLAIGLAGAITAFAIIDRVLFRPLPYHEPERLVSLVTSNQYGNDFALSIPNLLDLRAASRSIASVAAAIPTELLLDVGDASVEATSASVNREFFQTLGVAPLAGRFLGPDDFGQGAAPTVVLSHELWQRQYRGDRSIIGKTIGIGPTPFTVIGIAPQGFDFPAGAGMWQPCRWCERPPPNSRASMSAEVVARLADGVTIEQAAAETRVISEGIHQRYPLFSENQMRSILTHPLRDAVIGGAKVRVWTLGAAMGILLLIAAANLTSANLARAVSRGRELSVRSALGASRRRVVQQLTIETLAVCAIAASIGLLAAFYALRFVAAFGAAHLPRLSELGLDWRAGAFAVIVTLLVALAVGMLPALRLSEHDLRAGLVGGELTRRRLRRPGARASILAAQIALCLLLVTAAGLAGRSLGLVHDQPLGVEPSGLVMLTPQVNFRKYPTLPARAALYERLIREVGELPGVEGVAAVAAIPLGEAWMFKVELESGATIPEPAAGYNLVTPEYFATSGVPLLRGRLLLPTDDGTSEPVAVISRRMAEKFWPGTDPIGQRFRSLGFGEGSGEWLRVVGVVGNVRSYSLEFDNSAMHYVSLRQRPAMIATTTIIARVRGDAEARQRELYQVMRSIEPQMLARTTTMEQVIRDKTAARRETLGVLGMFAGIALVLAGIGIHGVLSYNVAMRTREIGVRMALGAAGGRVVRGVVAQLIPPVVAGVVAGIACSLAASRVFASFVFQVSPTSPEVMLGAALAIVTLALIAATRPAWRAASVDPLISLRAD